MKPKTRNDYVVQPGMAGGVAFVTAYEIENFDPALHADLLRPAPAARRSDQPDSRLATTAGRLHRAFRRLLKAAA